jgi:hypothetical protein
MAIKNNLILAASSEGSGEIALSIRGLKKTYKEGFLNRKGKEALKVVDFSIPRNKRPVSSARTVRAKPPP